LIDPERTHSGYRKFYVKYVDRLKSILKMQRDEYLPLKVIKERLLDQEGADGQGDGMGATAAGAVEPDEELRRIDRDEPGEQLLEPGGRVLRGAPAGLRERGQRRSRGHEISVRRQEGVLDDKENNGAESHTPSPSPP